MQFRIEEHKRDLGETPIENLFLNQYLALAKGDHLKVYLLAYKNAKSISSNKSLTNEDIAKELNLSLEEVLLAWDYWMQEGIVKRDLDIEKNQEVYTFLSMRELYLGIAEPYEYKPEEKEFVPLNSNEIAMMYTGIEEILGIELTPNEYERILDHMNDMGQEPQLIVKGFEYCAASKGKKNLNYVLGVLRNWHLDGIDTLKDFEEAQSKQEKRRQNLRRKRSYYKPGDKVKKVDSKNKDDQNLTDLFQKKFLQGLNGEEE